MGGRVGECGQMGGCRCGRLSLASWAQRAAAGKQAMRPHGHGSHQSERVATSVAAGPALASEVFHRCRTWLASPSAGPRRPSLITSFSARPSRRSCLRRPGGRLAALALLGPAPSPLLLLGASESLAVAQPSPGLRQGSREGRAGCRDQVPCRGPAQREHALKAMLTSM